MSNIHYCHFNDLRLKKHEYERSCFKILHSFNTNVKFEHHSNKHSNYVSWLIVLFTIEIKFSTQSLLQSIIKTNNILVKSIFILH